MSTEVPHREADRLAYPSRRPAPEPQAAPLVSVPPSGQHRGASTPDASVFLSRGQLLTTLLLVGAIAVGCYLRLRLTMTIVVAACTAFYVLTAALKLAITSAGRRYRPPRQIRMRPGIHRLPGYAVLLPVHKEANMLHHLVNRVERLEYPRGQLCVLLLIEHDDVETLRAARNLGIPFYDGRTPHQVPGGHLRVLVVPPGGPKTKPNALNAAMHVVTRERCEFVTIYDAEDRPQHDQLLKAVGTFRAAGPDLACLQAELAFWNDDTNWVTALYWIGYKIHFTRFLPGLARLGLPIPLGGTSNHFRVSALLDVALQPGGEAWDPHNLTEDADLGARLAAGGYRVDLLLSTTMEEAPVSIGVVDKQQRRWKAGYVQTGLVHTRRPLHAMRRMGPLRWACFNLLILGVPLTFMLNPLFFALTAAYFITGSAFIAQLFPTAVYYPAVGVMLLGNFLVVYELLYTCLTEAQQAKGRFDLVRYMLIAQLMWLWMSRSTYIAVFELMIGKRSWHKTPHGHAESGGLESPPVRAQPQRRPESPVQPPRLSPAGPPRPAGNARPRRPAPAYQDSAHPAPARRSPPPQYPQHPQRGPRPRDPQPAWNGERDRWR